MTRTKTRRGRRKNETQDNNDRAANQSSETKNGHIEAYYEAQKIIPDGEWQLFMEGLRRPLPTTFRVTGSREIAHILGDTIQKTYVPSLDSVMFENEPISPPSRIPWYPDGLAWQFNISKKVLRRSPEFKKFHSFLVHETEVGNLSRQEAVSMIPPLFLDVQPHHKVIDMCAAPGSKTAQLLEAIHANDTATFSSIPPGLLIANDSDSRRSHLLIHQSSRLPSPAFMVTNLDASIYPVLKFPSSQNDRRRMVKGTPSQLLFDRILCDVPCSGDGTLRKNLGIWKRWQPMDGNGLHGIQSRILQRAMRMLVPDGRIVYSTCSFNPVENEAVVAAALNSNPDFELLDVSDQFPELLRRPGLSAWLPAVDRTMNMSFATYHAYIESLPEDKRMHAKLMETHWPPSNPEALHLDRCMRIYPHLQDTGGFFIAVLGRNSKGSKTTSSEAPKRAVEDPDTASASDTKRAKLDLEIPPQNLYSNPSTATSSTVDAMDVQHNVGNDGQSEAESHRDVDTEDLLDNAMVVDPGFKEMPYTFLAPDDPTLQACIKQLNLAPSFPSSNILVRNPKGEPARSFYLTNNLVKSVLLHNDYKRLRLMTAGTKVIAKQGAARDMCAQYRVLGEGLPVVLPYIRPEAILEADPDALRILLQSYYPLCASFHASFQEIIETRGSGSHIVRFLGDANADATLFRDLVLPLWKSNVSVSLMVDKKVKSALSLRLFGEDVTIAAREQSLKKVVTKAENPETSKQVNEENQPIDEDSLLSDSG